MRIGVRQAPAGEQFAVSNELIDHRLVGAAVLALFLAFDDEDLLAGEAGGFFGESAEFIDRMRNFLLRAEGADPGEIVFLTVTGRGVHKARARLIGDVIACKERDFKVVAAFKAFQGVVAGDARKRFCRDVRDALPLGDQSRFAHAFSERIRKDQLVAGLSTMARNRDRLSWRRLHRVRRTFSAHNRSRGCRGSSMGSSSR